MPDVSRSARAAYTKMRDVAQKRLSRLARSEFSNTETYKNYASGFKRLSDLADPRAFEREFNRLSKFIAGRNSVSELKKSRAESIKTLHDNGYGFVNTKNFAQFGQFMEDIRSRYKSRYLPSDQTAEIFGQAQRLRIPAAEVERDFNYWREHQAEMERLPRARGKEKTSSAAYKKRAAALRKKRS